MLRKYKALLREFKEDDFQDPDVQTDMNLKMKHRKKGPEGALMFDNCWEICQEMYNMSSKMPANFSSIAGGKQMLDVMDIDSGYIKHFAVSTG